MVIWAELKGNRGRLTREQARWLAELPAHGAYLWRPRDLDQALEIISRGHPSGLAAGCWSCHGPALESIKSIREA